MHVVRHPLDVVLSCYAQPFEGRGTPWAWDLQGAPAHRAPPPCQALRGAWIPVDNRLQMPYGVVAKIEVADAETESPSARRCWLVRKEHRSSFPVTSASPVNMRVWATSVEIAHEVALTHEVMRLWDEVLPGRVLHVRYEDLVANQARCAARALTLHS